MDDLHDILMALPPVGQQTYLQVIQNEANRLNTLQLRPASWAFMPGGAQGGVGGQDASLYCAHCDLRYETTWFEGRPGRREDGHCFFCHRFRTPRITRFALLRETEWFFIQSGREQEEKRAFYEAYFFYLHRWADRFGLPHTQEELGYQEELWRSLPEEM